MKSRGGWILSAVLCLAVTGVLSPIGPVSAQSETIAMKFANFFPPPSAQSKTCEQFVADVEKRTGGKIKIQYFAGGSLLKAPQVFKGVTTGIADIGLSHVDYSPGRMPVTEVCDLPLGYTSGWVANQVVNDFYEKFRPKEWDDVQVLWMHASNPNVLITKKPVRTLEDLKGLTIRAPGTVGETVAALGGNPAPTPMMEAYDAVSKGVIDGINLPLEALKTWRFAEVAKYVTASWQVGNLYAFYVVMNKKSYAKLPPDLKGTFDQICKEYKEKFALMWNQIDIEGLEFAKSKGVEIIELTPDQVKRWKAAAAPAVNAYVKNMAKAGYPEADVRGWVKFLQEQIEYWTAKQIERKIKSATGPEAIRK